MDEIYVLPRAFQGVHQIPLSSSRHFEELFYRAIYNPSGKPLTGRGPIQGILSFADHLLTTRAYILQTYECLFQTREPARSRCPVDTSPHPLERPLEYIPLWPMDQTLPNSSSPASSHALADVSRHCEAGPRREGFRSYAKIPEQPAACATSTPYLLDRSRADRLYGHPPGNTSRRIVRG